MRKSININGIKFHQGELEWEDAYGVMRTSLPDFKEMRKGKKAQGRMVKTSGWIAQIGSYWLIISERALADAVFDYTLVPGRAKVILR